MPKQLIQHLALAPGTLYAPRGYGGTTVRVVGLAWHPRLRQEMIVFAVVGEPPGGRLFLETPAAFAERFVLLPVENAAGAESPAEPGPGAVDSPAVAGKVADMGERGSGY